MFKSLATKILIVFCLLHISQQQYFQQSALESNCTGRPMWATFYRLNWCFYNSTNTCNATHLQYNECDETTCSKCRETDTSKRNYCYPDDDHDFLIDCVNEVEPPETFFQDREGASLIFFDDPRCNQINIAYYLSSTFVCYESWKLDCRAPGGPSWTFCYDEDCRNCSNQSQPLENKCLNFPDQVTQSLDLYFQFFIQSTPSQPGAPSSLPTTISQIPTLIPPTAAPTSAAPFVTAAPTQAAPTFTPTNTAVPPTKNKGLKLRVFSLASALLLILICLL
eukprot:TRINITY_DN6541_c0_g2_i3.p1 TRINITY_DN6541_c0_g2~~TRINITY_DN6541_c0_g2_i3.p1  ORF type:complete len:290 (-),score=28.89 TRINITY_DN6541_c0_g2_i3:87-923(-)